MQTENSASKTKKWGLKLIRRGEKEKGSADKCSKRAEELISYKGNALFLKIVHVSRGHVQHIIFQL